MPLHVIKRGLDIPLAGRAEAPVVTLEAPETVAWSPTELTGIVPKLEAKQGAEVKAGQVLFHAKAHPEMKFLSPVAGKVLEVRRGRRRVITDIVVQRSGDGAVEFPTHTLADLETMGRDAARQALLASGLWGHLRTRPLDNVADPRTTPQSILIGGMETGPAMPGPDALLDAGDADAVQAGAFLLRALTDGPVFLALAEGNAHPALANVRGVEVHQFQGPHPAGDPSLQVNHVDPPRGHGRVWWIRAWEVALIGRFLLDGRYPSERVYAAVGPAVKVPRLVRTLQGAPLATIAGEVVPGDTRWVRGSAISGEAIGSDRWGGYQERAVTVLNDEVPRSLLGWIAPMLGQWSAHRAFVSGFFKASRPVDLRTGLWGGHRAIVPNAAYRRVVATPAVDAVFLFKSIIAGDMEESILLGMLDLTREEAALLTYVCPAKIEWDVLLQQGLQQYQKEM